MPRCTYALAVDRITSILFIAVPSIMNIFYIYLQDPSASCHETRHIVNSILKVILQDQSPFVR